MSRKYASVEDVMSIPIISINTNETAQNAIDKLKNKGVHKAVIFDSQKKKTIGYTDIWKLGLLSEPEQDMEIKDTLNNKKLISSEISSVHQDKPLKEVMPELLKKGILVVMNDEGKGIGVITPQDIRKVKGMELKL